MENIIILLVLIGLGYFIGTTEEKRHYNNILLREKHYKEIIVLTKTDTKKLEIEGSELLSGNVVISIDYFKKFIAGFINFFGGKVFVYESLIDRARREAVLRLKENAYTKGYNCLVNLKIETSSISQGTKGRVGSVEVLAYATGTSLKGVGKTYVNEK